MAQKSQSQYQQIKSIQSKTNNLQTRTPSQSSSPRQTQTEKRRYNCNTHNQNIYQKSTERNIPKIILLNSVCLTERSSLNSREDRWPLELNQKEDNSKEGLAQIYKELQSHGLLQAFQSFQTLRNFIIEDISLQKRSKSQQMHNKISMFELIADFKTKILHLQSQQSNYNQNQAQPLKQLLKQVSFLRTENCRLKQKLASFQQELSPDIYIHNSIFQNSLSFRDQSSATSNNTDRSISSLNLKIKKAQNESIQPFYLIQQDKIEPASCNQQDRHKKQTWPLKGEWLKCLSKVIVVCKQVFKNHLFSSNVAIYNSSRLAEMREIVKIYNSYKLCNFQRSQCEFIGESYRLIELIGGLSQCLTKVIRSELQDRGKRAQKLKC